MRRRKSSCPNIEPRRTSTTPNRNSVKLDLFIEDNEIHQNASTLRRNSPSPTTINDHRRRSSTNIEDTAEEVLCLRLLSTRTRYRFGGLRINLISPVFNVDKLFNVEFDQDSQISLIKSQQSNIEQTDNDSFFKNAEFRPFKEGKCATIVIEPESEDQKDEITKQLPLLTAELTLMEGWSVYQLSSIIIIIFILSIIFSFRTESKLKWEIIFSVTFGNNIYFSPQQKNHLAPIGIK